MDKFNLGKQPWIPCLMSDGTLKELSLFDTITQAQDIKEITDDSPLVIVSLHRLLLAILHRNFGPKSFDEWKSLWQKGFWDEEKLKSYFDKWQHRFNLFDEERPFYQYPKVTKKGGVDSDNLPIETLMQEKATGANATLFDHSFKTLGESYTPSIAARYLVARQSFSLAGGVSSPFNLSNGLLVKGFSILAVGDNLFQTLALNLIVYYRNKPMPVEDDDGVSLDKPFWERETLEEATESDKYGTTPRGYLDYLTWQSRRIKLLPEADFQSVKFCQLQQNFKLKENLNIFDPFKVYIEGEKGLYALDFKTHKSLWRNSHTIFKQSAKADEVASLFSHLTKISTFISAGEIEGRRKYAFSIIGIINDQASVETWMHETLPIPLAYFDDNDLAETLETAIKFAEEISEKLRAGIKKLAELLNTDAANFQAMPIYWSTLELKFQNLLSDLPNKKDAAMREWFSAVLATADDAFERTANSLSGSAEELKATVEARRLFGALRYKTRKSPNFKIYLPETKSKGGTQ
ncbi:MAG: type I-E CRISPR-associated protein Cse1/CasA [Acidobacteriota bacterium]|nr:type I-E CRISPR-associated protein Cse1/CasA [Acidobacteriota bacterium]